MSTKRGFYHKKCFSCIKCKTQIGYFNAIEGPDDEVKKNNPTISVFFFSHISPQFEITHSLFCLQVYCKICYKRYHGPGGHNKFGEKTEFPCDEESPEACIRCKGIFIKRCSFFNTFSTFNSTLIRRGLHMLFHNLY